jgi:hypothetical protein
LANGLGKGRATIDYGVSVGERDMINEHDCVVLLEDIPEEGLTAGDVGTVVHVHDKSQGYEVEFMTMTGNTIAVASMRATVVRAVASRDVIHVRELAVA